MRINELLNKVYPWQTQRDGWYEFKTADGRLANVQFDYLDEGDAFMTYIEFFVDKKSDITGGGDAHGIFGTVLDIVRDYLEKHPSHIISMTSKEPSRTRLYNHIAQRLGYQAVDNEEYIAIARSSRDVDLPLLPGHDEEFTLIFCKPEVRARLGI